MVRNYGVKLFTLTSGNLTADQMGEIIVRSMPKIIKFTDRTPPPFIATISKSGIIRKIEI